MQLASAASMVSPLPVTLSRGAPFAAAAKASSAAAAMVADVMRAGGIIDRVGSLYRRGTPERELVDINEIVREMTELLGDTAEAAKSEAATIMQSFDAGSSGVDGLPVVVEPYEPVV